MSLFAKIMICGWTTTMVMVALFALNESGVLLKAHRRLGEWLETLVPAENRPGWTSSNEIEGSPTS
jgi:hypothetical protein